ncbi:MarR family transcriptional regulator [Arenibaculum pallidiluteum]|uniref:MarR family transcriptional regulator n=1 Tax=Arenibaculum pallidiluteum TaxID=2812559 RepID=UPI001A97302B|nr:MarR family transcriptional regulator [Arenibaculum pallidiluteum]
MKSLIRQIDQAEREYRDGMARIAERLSELGLTDINAERALIVIRLGDRRMSVGEIEARGIYRGTNVSYNLQRLVDDGYVTRSQGSRDRRVCEVAITDKARRLIAALVGAEVEAA